MVLDGLFAGKGKWDVFKSGDKSSGHACPSSSEGQSRWELLG